MEITPYLYIPLATWVIAQGIKFTLSMVRGEVNLRYLFASGGMPSVHSAVVCSLVMVAFLEDGLANPLFGLSGVFAAIVMYDSLGVRRSSGEQAVTLNRLIDDLARSGKVRNIESYDHLREILGHKPLEVAAGATLGLIIAALFEYQKVGSSLNFLFNKPSLLLVKIIAVIGIVSIVFGFIMAYRINKRYKSKAYRAIANKYRYGNIILGILILIVAFGSYQHIALMDNYIFLLGSILLSLAWNIYLVSAIKSLKSESTDSKHYSHARKADWLVRAKNKRKTS